MSDTKAAAALAQDIEGKLHRHFGRSVQTASREQLFKACALCMRDRMSSWLFGQREAGNAELLDDREVHYLSLEFLLGRSLEKNAFNLGLLDELKEALLSLGTDPNDVFDDESDAGLGNGGLGRLAACYMDSMTSLGIKATGYSICYEYGIFKQKILEGQQIELPDSWMDTGDVWLTPHLDETEEVRFAGKIVETWEDGEHKIEHVDYQTVLAVPMDMLISGYETSHVNTLRLWDSKSPTVLDMGAFSRGEYMKALEQNAMADVITKILYPDDNHFEGKLLRLRQQYFFVSATTQNIIRKHKQRYGRLDNFHLKHVIHINDTHPTLIIPELMRIFVDEEKMDWEQAWSIVTHTVVYTNHTVMSEALECWPQNIVEMLLPRIWNILCEINDRFINLLHTWLMDDYRISQLAVVWDGQVRMANLCVYTCYAVNGVSELHSGILRTDLFREICSMYPRKFFNVTNGVDHRRWLAQINPGLDSLICELLGSREYLKRPAELVKLADHAKRADVGKKLESVKLKNKVAFSNWLNSTQGVLIDPSSIFDVQVKRMHEYKRQLLNVLHVVYLYRKLKEDPSVKMHPRTFLFGGKSASGYYTAKRIIRLINSLAAEINADPEVRDRLRVVYLENYNVTLAEHLMPAAEISEQISVAGREASGTGNMKFMLNGALTLGTMDGANVEIFDAVKDDNIFIFGLLANEVKEMIDSGSYSPVSYYQQNAALRDVLDMLSRGFSDGISYQDITQSLLIGMGQADPYFLLADFQSYVEANETVQEAYADRKRWNRMSLMNIAGAGRFAADRAVSQYANAIWNVATGR